MTIKKTRSRAPVGKELAKIRIDLDETLGYMAERLGVHAVHLSKVEGGLVAFSSALAQKVKEIYQVDLSHMINEIAADKLTFQLSRLSAEDRATIIEIHARMRSRKKDAVVDEAPKPVTRPAASAVPDVEGVDFLDDMSGLDELD